MGNNYLVARREISNNSLVGHGNLHYNIKDLPKGVYNIYRKAEILGVGLSPNQIPGFILQYCAKRESKGFRFSGKSLSEMVTNEEFRVVKT